MELILTQTFYVSTAVKKGKQVNNMFLRDLLLYITARGQTILPFSRLMDCILSTTWMDMQKEPQLTLHLVWNILPDFNTYTRKK